MTIAADVSNNSQAPLQEVRIVLVGDENVGKTALLHQYMYGRELKTYTPTLVKTYLHREYFEGQPYLLHLVDCSSKDVFQLHRAAYLAGCDAVVLVYSATKPESLENLVKWAREVVAARHGDYFSEPSDTTATAGVAVPTASGRKTTSTAPVEQPLGDVPIFIVGTNGDALLHFTVSAPGRGTTPTTSTTSSPTSLSKSTGVSPGKDSALLFPGFSRAETVTERCLHEVGFGSTTEDSSCGSWEGGQQSQGEGKREKKKPVKISGLLRRLFNSSHSTPKKYSVQMSGKIPKSTASEPLVIPSPVGEKAPSHGDDASVPHGASLRFPLYQLSTRDNVAVTKAFRAVLALHVLVRRAEALLSPGASPTTGASSALHFPFPRTPGGECFSLHNQKHLRTVSGMSNCSHQSERSGVSCIPTMGSLYGPDSLLDGMTELTSYQRRQSSGALGDVQDQLRSRAPSESVALDDVTLIDGTLVSAMATTPLLTSVHPQKASLVRAAGATGSVGDVTTTLSGDLEQTVADLCLSPEVSVMALRSFDADKVSQPSCSNAQTHLVLGSSPLSRKEVVEMETAEFVADDIVLSAAPASEDAPQRGTTLVYASGKYSAATPGEAAAPPDCSFTKIPDQRKFLKEVHTAQTEKDGTEKLGTAVVADSTATILQLKHDADKMASSDFLLTAAHRLELCDNGTFATSPSSLSNAANGLSSTFSSCTAAAQHRNSKGQLSMSAALLNASPSLHSIPAPASTSSKSPSPQRSGLSTGSRVLSVESKEPLHGRKRGQTSRPVSPAYSHGVNSPATKNCTDTQKHTVTRCSEGGCVVM